jgi:S1-C subfamily serine protease
MRRSAWLTFVLLLVPVIASAAQPKCPLPLDSCIVRFGRMHERPWLGVVLHLDSLSGHDMIDSVVVGTPAFKAGFKRGDVLQTIDDRPALDYFLATKAGWKDGDTVHATVLRNGHDKSLPFRAQHIPEELFARIVGEHMIEGHLAYMMDLGGSHEPDVR